MNVNCDILFLGWADELLFGFSFVVWCGMVFDIVYFGGECVADFVFLSVGVESARGDRRAEVRILALDCCLLAVSGIGVVFSRVVGKWTVYR